MISLPFLNSAKRPFSLVSTLALVALSVEEPLYDLISGNFAASSGAITPEFSRLKSCNPFSVGSITCTCSLESFSKRVV